MATLDPTALVQLLQQQQQLQKRQQELARQPVNTGILNEGQSWTDLLTNPTEAQGDALMRVGISLLSSMDNPNTMANIGNALGRGPGHPGGCRAARRQNQMEGLKQEQEALDKQFSNVNTALSQQRQYNSGEGELWENPQTGQTLRLIEDYAGQVRDPRTGQVVYPERMGLVPYSRPSTTVNVGAGESAFKKELGKIQAGRFTDVLDRASAAQRDIAAFQQLSQLTEQMNTGVGAEALGDLQNAAVSFLSTIGAEVPEEIRKGAADADTLRKLTVDQAFSRIADTKGSVSDKEMETFIKGSAGIRNTREGNRMIVNMGLATARADQEKAQFFQAWLDKHGNLNGADSAWTTYTNDVPKTAGRDAYFQPLDAAYNKWQPYLDGGKASWTDTEGNAFTVDDLKETARKHGLAEGEVLNMLIQRGVIRQ